VSGFIRHVGRTILKIANKQHTNTHTRRTVYHSVTTNLTCSTDIGIMFKNLTLQDADAVSSSV